MENEKKNYFEEVKELAAKYADDKLLLIKLQAAERAAKISSSLFKLALLVGILFFIITILSFLVGYFLSAITGNFFYGFGLLACIYIILFVVVIYLHKKFLHKYISDKVVEMFFYNKEEL